MVDVTISTVNQSFYGVQMPLRDLILVQLLLGDEIARQRAPDSALDDILALGGNQAALLDGLTDGIGGDTELAGRFGDGVLLGMGFHSTTSPGSVNKKRPSKHPFLCYIPKPYHPVSVQHV